MLGTEPHGTPWGEQAKPPGRYSLSKATHPTLAPSWGHSSKTQDPFWLEGDSEERMCHMLWSEPLNTPVLLPITTDSVFTLHGTQWILMLINLIKLYFLFQIFMKICNFGHPVLTDSDW